MRIILYIAAAWVLLSIVIAIPLGKLLKRNSRFYPEIDE